MKKLKRAIFIFRNAAEKGFILIISAVLAILIANNTYSRGVYESFFSLNLSIGPLELSIKNWINEFLMSIFFLLVGMEIKRELIVGHLSEAKQRLLPIISACGGVIFPVIIYSAFNISEPVALKGWAIPSATDIAFAISVLSVVGKNIPTSLRVFLTALAIIDDLIAISIIGLFYSGILNPLYIASGLLFIMMLAIYSRSRYYSTKFALCIGFLIWNCILLSGIHATISGVIVGLLIPMNGRDGKAPLIDLEKRVYPITTYLILPLFAFANSGLYIPSFDSSSLLHPVTLGVALGLFIGKQLGVMFSFLMLRLFKLFTMPQDANLKQLYGVSILCGIGFTMSLFIAIMSFENNLDMLRQAQLGVFIGSVSSALAGAIVLKLARNK
jgi:NhaA family Na+:H+ antiporter